MIDESILIKEIKQEAKGRFAGLDTCISFEEVILWINQQLKIGEWIPCSKRLPDEKTNPITKDFYEYQVTFQSGKIKDIRHYKFGKGHWWNGPDIMDEYVTAWKELPEAYHE